MRVPTSAAANAVVDQLRRLGSRQADLQTQAATGQRISRPGDDPAAAGRVIAHRLEQRSLVQFQRNADHALAASTTAFSSLREFKKLSDRAGELVTLGAGITSAEARAAYAAEVGQLVEQAIGLGGTRYQQDYVFAGTAVAAPPFAVTRDGSGQPTAVTYAGDLGVTEVPLAEGGKVAPLPTGATNQGLVDFVNQLIALRDRLAAGDGPGALALGPALENSENQLVEAIAAHGAVQLRIEISTTQQRARLDEVDRQIGLETDADLAGTLVRLSQTTTAYEAALSSSASMLRMSLLDYLK